MKPTGTLTFTRHADGSISRKWEGGRRIIISGDLIKQMFGKRPQLGDVYDFNGTMLRLVAYEPVAATASRAYYACSKEIEVGPDIGVTISIDPLIVVHVGCIPADAITPGEFGGLDVRDNRSKFKKDDGAAFWDANQVIDI